MQPIRVLRPARDTTHPSALSFEDYFRRHVGPICDLTIVPAGIWRETILGSENNLYDDATAAQNFAAALTSTDFLCPAHDLLPLVPYLLALRNRSRSNARLLLIAHTAGACGFDWALLAPLLRPGDRVLPPTHSAAGAMELLCPATCAYTRVVGHPIGALRPNRRRQLKAQRTIVSMGRVIPSKLIHTQIEALARLQQRTRRIPRLRVVGDLLGGAEGGHGQYRRSLAALANRLGVAEHVEFVGPVRGDSAKAEILDECDLMLNLSVSAEETFGMTPIEALGCGVPVLATKWDGLTETVGLPESLVPLHSTREPDGPIEADPEVVADYIERLLDSPPSPEECRNLASRFDPAVITPQFREILDGAIQEREDARDGAYDRNSSDDDQIPAVHSGLLSVTAPLTNMSWSELFHHYSQSVLAAYDAKRRRDGPTLGFELRRTVLMGTLPWIERWYAGLQAPETPTTTAEPGNAATQHADPHGEVARIFACASPATLSSRVACAFALYRSDTQAAFEQLRAFGQEATNRPELLYLQAERARLEGRATALPLAGAALHRFPPLANEAYRVRQFAALAAAEDSRADAIEVVTSWLARNPELGEAGRVWLVLAELLLERDPLRAAAALGNAQALLGATSALEDVRRRIDAQLETTHGRAIPTAASSLL